MSHDSQIELPLNAHNMEFVIITLGIPSCLKRFLEEIAILSNF